MNWRAFAIALLLPIWVTGATLASVSRNRSGGRDPIVLSEREVFVSPRSDDNTTATLWLAWQPSAGMNARMAARAAEAAGDPAASGDRVPSSSSRMEDRSLPRQAFIALELNGPAFRALPVERERERTSRLVAIDIDPDARVLAQRYPNARTHLISAGVVRVTSGGSLRRGDDPQPRAATHPCASRPGRAASESTTLARDASPRGSTSRFDTGATTSRG